MRREGEEEMEKEDREGERRKNKLKIKGNEPQIDLSIEGFYLI